ncbi:MAG: M16 family metallopeptidase [Crocinitomicaceae bacterium]
MNRKIAPELSKIKQVDLLNPKKIDLGNDIDLFWINDIPDDTVKLDLIWDAGSKYQNKPLISQFCNHLLFSGNDNLSAKEIATKIDEFGGYLSHQIDRDHAGFTVFGLTKEISSIFDIIQSAFMNNDFVESEVNKWRDIKKKEFDLNEEKVNIKARRLFIKSLVGKEHPYGKFATKNDFDLVNRKDLKSFFKVHYVQKKPAIFLVGNVSKSFIGELKTFASFFSETHTPLNVSPTIQSKGSVYKTKADAVQTAIRVGRLCMNKKDSDFIPFQILNVVLGGYFGSRLMTNIREDKGYTYGIGSGISVQQDLSYFFISTEVGINKREDTLKEIYFELEKLRTELIPQSELLIVKNYMLGSFLRNSDGAIAMMEKNKNLYFQNLSKSYYNHYISTINDITPDRLREIAIKYFDKSDFSEVSFG